jgi:type II secretory pathway pseudopilin PulG
LRGLAKTEAGFGLIELLIAMSVMVIAIMAIVAAFSSGMVALNRASQASTAATIADSKMESFRRMAYTSIAASSGPQTGPDGRTYQVNSTVDFVCLAGTLSGTTCTVGPGPTRPAVKRVTVVVSDPTTTPPTVFSETSDFDQATG